MLHHAAALWDLESIKFRIGVERNGRQQQQWQRLNRPLQEGLRNGCRVACGRRAHTWATVMLQTDAEFRAVAGVPDQLFIRRRRCWSQCAPSWLMGCCAPTRYGENHVHYNIYRSIANKKGDDTSGI